MTFSPDHRLALFNEHGFHDTTLIRSRSFSSTSDLGLYVDHDLLGAKQPLHGSALQLRNPYLRLDRNLGWSIDWAVASFVDRLECQDAINGLRNVRIRAAALESKGLIEQIPFRIFNKLDEVLFAGHLKDAVFLDVTDLDSDVSGATYTHGLGPDRNVKRISIILNDCMLRYGGARDVVAVLIHHMIHAYFLVACGPQREDEVDYGRLAHGVHFGKILLAIRKLSAAHGKELTPLDFGHNLGKLQYFAEEYSSSSRRTSIEREEHEEWFCSHCHVDVQRVAESDIDKWYKKVCSPMFDEPKSIREAKVTVYNDRRQELETKSRARLPPSSKTVELMFKNKPILLETKFIDEYPEICRAFHKTGSRYIKVHKEISEGTFLRFLEFLHTGAYSPIIQPYAATTVSLGSTRKGPPVIKTENTGSKSCLLHDVEFAKLGVLMHFEECKSYALRRMNSYGAIFEDPVAILKELYSGPEPDPDLKAWSRKFLVQATTTPSKHRSSNFASHIGDPPNLIKLEDLHSPHRIPFLDAINSNGALENDVTKAKAELKAAGWYDSLLLSPYSATSLECGYDDSSPRRLGLGLTRPSHSLLDSALSSAPSYHARSTDAVAPSNLLSRLTGLSLKDIRDIKRVTDFERSNEQEYFSRLDQKAREKERAREEARERDRLRRLERSRERRERDRLIQRRKEREREMDDQLVTAVALEDFLREHVGFGFVEDDDEI
ncbi:hypothetical protein ACN47E_001931 [Coniothyrium glycines]